VGLALLACAALVPLYSSFWPGSVPLYLKALLALLLAITMASPAHGLLMVVGLVPFDRLFSPGVQVPPIRVSEGMVLAFLGGWLVRRIIVPMPRTRTDWTSPLALLSVLVAASAIVEVAALQPTIADVGPFASQVWRFLSAIYLLPTGTFLPLAAAALLLEGLGVMAVAARLSVVDPKLPRRLLLVGTAAAFVVATLNLVELVRRLSAGAVDGWPRISVNDPDLNAAGSYFILFLPAACLLAREKSVALAVGVGAWFVAAIWLTGSRAAFAAAILLAAAGALVYRVPNLFASRKRVALAVAAIILAAVASAAIATTVVMRSDAQASRWLDLRREFAFTSFRMIETDPIFGIGAGQYYSRSASFMSPELLRIYPSENAHNNFLQIGAELGIAGLAMFLWLLASVGVATLRSDADAVVKRAALAGLAGFLVTCVTGHPLLVYEVAYPFWLMMSVAAGLAVSNGTDASDGMRRGLVNRRWALPVVLAIVVVSVPVRVAWKVSRLDMSGVVYGLHSPLRDTATGRTYRWTTDTATVFIRREARAFQLPARLLNVPDGASAEVFVQLDGRPASLQRIGTGWGSIGLRLPLQRRAHRYRRLDLSVVCGETVCPQQGRGALAIGAPEVE
jgi:putative inorganic carbon (HCO3(-)) transporter